MVDASRRALPQPLLDGVLHQDRNELGDSGTPVAGCLVEDCVPHFSRVGPVGVLPAERVGDPTEMLVEDLAAKLLASIHAQMLSCRAATGGVP
jgi:hypothetical protein